MDDSAGGDVGVGEGVSGYVEDSAAGGVEVDEDEDYYDEEDDYPDEDWDEEEEPLPTSNSPIWLRNYREEIEPNTNNDYYSQDRESLSERKDIAFSNKPNPILPTNRQELLRVYEENLSNLQRYDENNLNYDEESRRYLREATNALMKLKNYTFQQAKDYIAGVRSQHRQAIR